MGSFVVGSFVVYQIDMKLFLFSKTMKKFNQNNQFNQNKSEGLSGAGPSEALGPGPSDP